MSFDLKAFVKKSWDTFRGGDTTIGIGQWRPSDGLLALLNKPELVAGLIPHIPDYISDLTTSSTEELSDKANELLGLDPGTLTADNLGVLLGYIRDETPEAFNSVLAELTGTTPLEVFQAVYEYSSKKAVDSLGLDGVPTNTTDPKWYAYFDELQNILGAGGRSREEAAEDYFRQAGYEPSPEELEEILMGDAFPTRTAIEVYVDPRQVTNDEVIERLERVGIDVEGQAEAAGQTPEEYAEQIKQSIPPGDGSEAAFDDAMIMSLTSTAAGGTGSASFKEALSKMGTGVKNLLFGTNSGRPKPWLQILKEQIEKKYFPTFEDQMPGFPLEIVFDLDGASAANPTGALVRANLKIPVPFPVNGPPIVIPLFSENGTYVGPTTPKGLFLEPDTGIIRQIEAGVVDTAKEIGRIFEGAQGAVIQVFDEVGNVFRAIPLAEYEAWKEGGKNPFDIETNENGEVIPQTDENGNPATGYDPDTGLPVYEAPDDADADNTTESGIPRRERITGPPTDRQIALAYRLYALTGDRTMLNEIAAYNAEIAGIAETARANEEGGIASEQGGANDSDAQNDARLVLDTLEDTLDGLGLDIDEIETILNRVETDLQNVTTAEDLETFRTNLINELLDPDTGLPSMGIDEDELGDALDPITKSVDDLGTAIAGVAEDVTNLGETLNDRIDALVDQGMDRAEAVDQALADLSDQLNTSTADILEQLGTTEANLAEDIEAVAEDVEAVAGDLSELAGIVDGYIAQGLSNDEALAQAISDLSDQLGVTEDTLLTSLGETEETILDAVEGVSAQIDATNVSIDNLNALIVQYELDGKTRDEALSLALNDLSTDLGITKEEILTSIGETEETIIARINASDESTDAYLTYISQIIGIPATDLTQEDIDFVVGLIGEDEAITDINNDIRIYDANFDGVINDIDIGLLQGFVDAGVDGVGEIPATGLYADAAQRQLELTGYISDQDDITRGLISREADATRGLMGATTLFNAMLGAGDLSGTRVDVSTPDPARINYIYDFEDVFATPQQKSLFPSPYGKPQMAQQQQMAQRQSSTSGPLQIGGMAQGGKVDYDFTDEIMQIMRYGDS
jgi:hypothetical protein